VGDFDADDADDVFRRHKMNDAVGAWQTRAAASSRRIGLGWID